jgi:hypothetical protein
MMIILRQVVFPLLVISLIVVAFLFNRSAQTSIEKIQHELDYSRSASEVLGEMQMLQRTMQHSFASVMLLPDTLNSVRSRKRDSVIINIEQVFKGLLNIPLRDEELIAKRKYYSDVVSNSIQNLKTANLDSIYLRIPEHVNRLAQSSRDVIQRGEAIETDVLPTIATSSSLAISHKTASEKSFMYSSICLILAVLLSAIPPVLYFNSILKDKQSS